MEKAKIIEQYYYYYMISLYYLIKEYGCEWDFHSINEKIFLNGTNLKYDEFARNKYLEEFQDNKVGLAEDILNNGMYFPYFAYGLKTEQQSKDTISLALGKHRLYSKLLYQKKKNIKIDKKFLFIYVPNELTPSNNFNYFNFLDYRFYTMQEDGSATIRDHRFKESKKLMKFFDLTGGFLSNSLLNSFIATNPILNDQDLFEQFINNPLDYNNIMFSVYKNIKDTSIDLT